MKLKCTLYSYGIYLALDQITFAQKWNQMAFDSSPHFRPYKFTNLQTKGYKRNRPCLFHLVKISPAQQYSTLNAPFYYFNKPHFQDTAGLRTISNFPIPISLSCLDFREDIACCVHSVPLIDGRCGRRESRIYAIPCHPVAVLEILISACGSLAARVVWCVLFCMF